MSERLQRRFQFWLVVVVVGCCSTIWSQEAEFQRGDSNADGNFDISDAVFTLRMLFLNEPPSGCDDAADMDDDGVLNVTDGVYGMRFLFLDGPPPPPPFGACGEDRTDDDISCNVYRICDEGELCIDQGLIDGLLGELSPETLDASICIPAGLLTIPLDALSVSVCPEDEADPCGLTQILGCPLVLTSMAASLAGQSLVVRLEGRMEDLPVVVTETLFNSTTTCLVDLGGEAEGAPFSFETAIPLLVEEVRPGVQEIVGLGEPSVEGVDFKLSASGGLLCLLFEAGQDAFIGLLAESIESILSSVTGPLGEQLLGLRLCDSSGL